MSMSMSINKAHITGSGSDGILVAEGTTGIVDSSYTPSRSHVRRTHRGWVGYYYVQTGMDTWGDTIEHHLTLPKRSIIVAEGLLGVTIKGLERRRTRRPTRPAPIAPTTLFSKSKSKAPRPISETCPSPRSIDHLDQIDQS